MNKGNAHRSGCIWQRDGEHVTIRVKVLAGILSSGQMSELGKLAGQYGRGIVQITARMGIEIPWVREKDVETISEKLAPINLRTGSTGPTVRAIVACKGTTCRNGLIDTQELCRTLDRDLFGKRLPAKFKIRVSGCPNNCVKARTNDLDFIGQYVPTIHKNCAHCGLCIDLCPTNALVADRESISLDRNVCLNCGKCARICPEGAIDAVAKGVSLFLGGKFGRQYRIGKPVDGVFPVEAIPELTKKLLRYYENHAHRGERLGDTLERTGMEDVLKELSGFRSPFATE